MFCIITGILNIAKDAELNYIVCLPNWTVSGYIGSSIRVLGSLTSCWWTCYIWSDAWQCSFTPVFGRWRCARGRNIWRGGQRWAVMTCPQCCLKILLPVLLTGIVWNNIRAAIITNYVTVPRYACAEWTRVHFVLNALTWSWHEPLIMHKQPVDLAVPYLTPAKINNNV